MTLSVLFAMTACHQSTEPNEVNSSDVLEGAEELSTSSDKVFDLNVVSDPSLPVSDDTDFSEREILPDMFDQAEKETRVSVGAKPLRDVENEDYVQSVQGAELKVEFKTD